MPYVRDKAHRAACRHLLGLSHNDLNPVLDRSGRIVLDTADQGQHAFQAMLHTCLFSRDREHPLDRMEGRSFPDLLLYFGGLSARPDRLVLRLSCAARIARFLLATQRTNDDGTIELTGLPGLRLESASDASSYATCRPARALSSWIPAAIWADGTLRRWTSTSSDSSSRTPHCSRPPRRTSPTTGPPSPAPRYAVPC